jgi:aspartyl-tRNA(Asn)/glutamyl-tRNA(Gln) amidotransferase subunit A
MDDPLQMYLSDVFTVPASLAGLPAVSIPSGLSPEGLPLGLQVVAPRFEEERMFAAARAFEREIGFPADAPAALAALQS